MTPFYTGKRKEQMRWVKIIFDMLFTFMLLFVLSIDCILIRIGTKTTQYAGAYAFYFYSFIIVFIVASLNFKILNSRPISLMIMGLFLGIVISILSDFFCSLSVIKYNHIYFKQIVNVSTIRATLDSFLFFRGWLITPLILLWIKFVFIYSPDSASSKKER